MTAGNYAEMIPIGMYTEYLVNSVSQYCMHFWDCHYPCPGNTWYTSNLCFSFLMICICVATDMAPSLTLIYEQPEGDLMLRKPYIQTGERLIDFGWFVVCFWNIHF